MQPFLKIAAILVLLVISNVIFYGSIIWATLGALRFFGVL